MAGRKPDFYLNAMNKETNEKVYRIGAAWRNETNGSIIIQVNRFVVLPTDSAWILTLFINDREPQG